MTLKKRVNFGWIPDSPDPRDHKFKANLRALSSISLPTRVDLTERHNFRVYDQGMIGSCVAHATASAIEYAHAIRPNDPNVPDFLEEDRKFPVSRLFLYYEARQAIGLTQEDSGCMIRDCLRAAYNIGAPRETGWKYDESKFATKPPKRSYKYAPYHKITAYKAVNVNALELKVALASGLPVLFGVMLFDSFFSGPDVPTPRTNEGILGGHCMLAVGYDDSTRRVKFLNSWGTEWGREGYGTIPYSYIGNPRYGDDYWTITDPLYKERM